MDPRELALQADVEERKKKEEDRQSARLLPLFTVQDSKLQITIGHQQCSVVDLLAALDRFVDDGHVGNGETLYAALRRVNYDHQRFGKFPGT